MTRELTSGTRRCLYWACRQDIAPQGARNTRRTGMHPIARPARISSLALILGFATVQWVSFGPTGTAYQISLSFDANTARNGVLVSKSADGGDTWSEPTSLIRDSGNRDVSYAFNDKESITADPTNSNYAYAVWDRFTTPSGTSLASIEGLIHSRSFREPVWFSRTTNGGATWEPARNIYDRSEFNGTIGNQIVVLPNGTLLDFFDEFFVHNNSNNQRSESISVIRSTVKAANQ